MQPSRRPSFALPEIVRPRSIERHLRTSWASPRRRCRYVRTHISGVADAAGCCLLLRAADGELAIPRTLRVNTYILDLEEARTRRRATKVTSRSWLLVIWCPSVTTIRHLVVTKAPHVTTIHRLVVTGGPFVTTIRHLVVTKAPFVTTTRRLVVTKAPFVTTTRRLVVTKAPFVTTTRRLVVTGVPQITSRRRAIVI